MNFERGKDPKETMSIGLGALASIVNKINRALPLSEKYQDFLYCPEERATDIRHSWIKKGGGSYFTIYRSPSVDLLSPKKYREYFIQYDFGGFDYGNIPIYDFLTSIGAI